MGRERQPLAKCTVGTHHGTHQNPPCLPPSGATAPKHTHTDTHDYPATQPPGHGPTPSRHRHTDTFTGSAAAVPRGLPSATHAPDHGERGGDTHQKVPPALPRASSRRPVWLVVALAAGRRCRGPASWPCRVTRQVEGGRGHHHQPSGPTTIRAGSGHPWVRGRARWRRAWAAAVSAWALPVSLRDGDASGASQHGGHGHQTQPPGASPAAAGAAGCRSSPSGRLTGTARWRRPPAPLWLRV
mmetsp:Transcript_4818/g.11181  ORF Transcript_4818/g.11181 Transcript_4818/m.11181 type:complete len:242 (+) Transcript_4818:335-1060(+)